ncbi:MAG: hypothetical protein ABI051_06805 [Vicinamibacterales bacterium]
MALPWLAALRAIPWNTILANAPAIARSADALLSGTRPTARHPDLRQQAHVLLAERVGALEQRDRETAELLTQISAQLAAVAAATEVLEVRVRWLLVVSFAAVVLALLATVLAFVVR